MDKRLNDFFIDIERVCAHYKLSISHEDGHGAFIIEEYQEDNIKWLEEAHIRIKEDKSTEDDNSY